MSSDMVRSKGGMDATGIADAYRFISSLNTYDPSGEAILFNDTLGTVYLTVNPAKTDFTGLTVGIENSIEEQRLCNLIGFELGGNF